ncbi:MAG: DUF512 domain-containing protein [Pyrinomonadaceae bacterium]
MVPRQCANDCLFCFCKGNPPDARPSLFIRDEDIRLSFPLRQLHHAHLDHRRRDDAASSSSASRRSTFRFTRPMLDVRAYLLSIDKRARGHFNAKMRRMMDAGIEIHAQVVLCPEINDGEVLRRTIDDLAALLPAHHERRHRAARPHALQHRRALDRRHARVLRAHHTRNRTVAARTCANAWARPSLCLATRFTCAPAARCQPRGHYGDYPQIEDGIGMVRSFQNSCDALLRRLARRPPQKPERFSATVMTGTLFAPILERSLALLNDKFRTDFEVVAVENTYFGGDVSVAGLLTGSDILAARGRVRKPLLIVPRSAIKSDETVMLDGMTIAELERQLAVPVVAYDFASLCADAH